MDDFTVSNCGEEIPVYGIGFEKDKAAYYVTIHGQRVAGEFSTMNDAIIFIDRHHAKGKVMAVAADRLEVR